MKMKKFISLIIAFIFIFGTVTTAFAENAEGDIVVLYTNDVHCAIDDYAVLAAYRAELISQGNTVVAIDAGDAIQGEVIGAMTEGSAIVEIMNASGYDYAVPGNHEFDYGMETFLDLAENKAEYEYISSNFYDLTSVSPVLEPYAIKDVNGTKVAFVGITTPETITKSTPDYFKNEDGNFIYGFPTYPGDMSDEMFYENIQKSVDSAIKDGADIVIAAGHLGIAETTDGWKSTDVIAETEGIDVFLDAHSHEKIESATYKNKNGEDVILSSTQTKFEYFGQLTISTDGTMETELINPDEIDVETLSSSAQGEYTKVKNIIDRYKSEIEYLYEGIGISETTLVAYDTDKSWAVRKRETNAGDFVADAYRAVTGADVAIANGGGIRADVAIGNVSRKNLMDVNAFNNDMCVLEVTGQQLVDVLEHGARNCPESLGGFFQVSGVTFEIHTYLESPVITDSLGNFMGMDETLERRVQNVLVNNEPVDLNKTYTLAGSAYVLAQGGDGLTMLEDAEVVESENLPCDSEMLIKYFTENLNGVITEEQYGNPDGEGRIKIIDKHVHKFSDSEICACGKKKADYSGYHEAMERYYELTDKYKDVLTEETKDYIREEVQKIVKEYLGGTGVKNNYSEDEQYILDGIADGINEICDYIEEGIADGTLTGCEHICHSSNWFLKIVWSIANFFHRIFGILPVCECGLAHY
ncbi:MAG: bifunctional metallophosphatase/5'-nucleotidase [Clostridia bacterium]|nr:bifunctional metallophosphatase/5'-nucleotidase [Clostridia bacterium]